jgi:hypothetical protein
VHNPSPIDYLENQQDTRNSARLVDRRILTRLNVTESAHIELRKALEAFRQAPPNVQMVRRKRITLAADFEIRTIILL